MPDFKDKLKNKSKILKEFEKFLRVELGLEEKTIDHHTSYVKKLLEFCKGEITREKIIRFLEVIKATRSPYQFNNYLKAFRRFFKDFLKVPELVDGIKYSRPKPKYEILEDFPSLEDIRKGFEVLKDDLERALYLFFVTTGLRKSEVLNLKKKNILWEYRAVIPEHFSRTKRSGITFFNEETEYHLKKYLETRKDNDDRLFIIGDKKFRQMWKRVSEHVGKKITPQVLRKWFAFEMRKRGIPDSFIDIFQGRAPRNVLEQYYTPIRLEELKKVYKKAKLRVIFN